MKGASVSTEEFALPEFGCVTRWVTSESMCFDCSLPRRETTPMVRPASFSLGEDRSDLVCDCLGLAIVPIVRITQAALDVNVDQGRLDALIGRQSVFPAPDLGLLS